MTPAPPRLPKWIIPHHHQCSGMYPCRFYRAFEIAWVALDVYSKTYDGKEAEKAMRAIRRIGK